MLPGLVDVGDQVALGDLLVIQVVEDLAARRVHRLADGVGLRHLGQKHAGVIGPGIQRLQHHDQARGLGDLGHRPQGVDDVGGLVVPLQLVGVAPGHHGAPPRVHPLGHLNSFVHLLGQKRPVLGLASHIRRAVRLEISVGHEDAHRHAQLGHRRSDFLLRRHVAAHHAVVFPRGKPLAVSKAELLRKIVARVVLERAKVRRVLQLEGRSRRGGVARAGRGPHGQASGGGESCGEYRAAIDHGVVSRWGVEVEGSPPSTASRAVAPGW